MVQSLIWVRFDAHFDSSATMLAANPKVENFTTGDGFLIIDWSNISVISKLPVSIALCSCRGSRSKDFSIKSFCGFRVVRSIRLSPILARIIGGVRLSFAVSSWWYMNRILGGKGLQARPTVLVRYSSPGSPVG